MDSYEHNERLVTELKPDNPRAIRRGMKQAQTYCDECDRAYIRPRGIGGWCRRTIRRGIWGEGGELKYRWAERLSLSAPSDWLVSDSDRMIELVPSSERGACHITVYDGDFEPRSETEIRSWMDRVAARNGAMFKTSVFN